MREVWVLDLDAAREKFRVPYGWLNGKAVVRPEFEIEIEEGDPKDFVAGLASGRRRALLKKRGLVSVTVVPDEIERPEEAETAEVPVLLWKPTPWVFISSVQRELEDYRDAAVEATLRARMLPVAMENWSAEARAADAACKKHLAPCDVVVLVVGHRYGSVHEPTGIGYTEIELGAAAARSRLSDAIPSILDRLRERC